MPTALVLGATSGIGEAVARRLASEGYDLVLAGRSEAPLQANARDLEVRYGVRARVRLFEALDFASHAGWIEDCAAEIEGGLSGVLLCYGAMEDESEAASDPERARRMIDVNFSSPVSILDRAAEHLSARGEGWICALSSVAGVRGRASNFHYGATKAGLSAYLSGLRVRLGRVGVGVIDVRPGIIDTKLTFGLPGLVFPASPERVARDVSKAIRKNRAVVYTPRIWQPIMLVIRLLPDFVFRRLSL